MTAPTDHERESMQWGFKLVATDLTTGDHQGGRYRYRLGEWHHADPGDREFSGSRSACPQFPGDGLCVARTLAGAASGGHRVGSSTMLIVGYALDDVLAKTAAKVLVSRLWVEPDPVDPVRLLKWAAATGTDMRGAYLEGAYLQGADLRSAYLQGADLRSAYLRGADLRGANLRGANLWGADLQGANLRGADLRGAYLRGAYLRGADLRGADLWDAVVNKWTVLPDGWHVVNGRIEAVS